MGRVGERESLDEATIDSILEPPDPAAFEGAPPFAAKRHPSPQIQEREVVPLWLVALERGASQDGAKVVVQHRPLTYGVHPSPRHPGMIRLHGAVPDREQVSVAFDA